MIKQVLKWPGGKEKELGVIKDNLPDKYNNIYDPFVGGGSVYIGLEAEKYFINDKSHELISLYNQLKLGKQSNLFSVVADIDSSWGQISEYVISNKDFFLNLFEVVRSGTDYNKVINKYLKKEKLFYSHLLPDLGLVKSDVFLNELEKNLSSKLSRMRKIELEKGLLPDKDVLDNIESALKSAFYMYIRFLYNNIDELQDDHIQSAVFYFIRNYAYSGMFRYNKNGDFNVPYGGIGYNKNSLKKKIEGLQSDDLQKRLKKTKIFNLDFSDFIKKVNPEPDDFVFLDPPYDTDFSTYAKNTFDKSDQERLADYLIRECRAKWMLVIKHTDFINGLYNNKKGINIKPFDKSYRVSFMNRNDKDVTHLLITNY